jgi:hypothetical protein
LTEAEQNQNTTAPAAAGSENLVQAIASKEKEITALKKSESDLKEQLATANQALTEAVTGYKNRVIQLHPGITEELLGGATIAAVDQSLEKAIGLISRVKKSVENEIFAWKSAGRRAGETERRPFGLNAAGKNSIRDRRKKVNGTDISRSIQTLQ